MSYWRKPPPDWIRTSLRNMNDNMCSSRLDRPQLLFWKNSGSWLAFTLRVSLMLFLPGLSTLAIAKNGNLTHPSYWRTSKDVPKSQRVTFLDTTKQIPAYILFTEWFSADSLIKPRLLQFLRNWSTKTAPDQFVQLCNSRETQIVLQTETRTVNSPCSSFWDRRLTRIPASKGVSQSAAFHLIMILLRMDHEQIRIQHLWRIPFL